MNIPKEWNIYSDSIKRRKNEDICFLSSKETFDFERRKTTSKKFQNFPTLHVRISQFPIPQDIRSYLIVVNRFVFDLKYPLSMFYVNIDKQIDGFSLPVDQIVVCCRILINV